MKFEPMHHPSDTYTFKNGHKLRILNDSVLVKMDSESEKTAGGIIKPGDAVVHIYMTGSVLAFGWIRKHKLPDTTETKMVEPYPIPDLEVGLKCCFIRYRRWQDTNKQLRHKFEDDIIALKPEDLIFVFPKNEKYELG